MSIFKYGPKVGSPPRRPTVLGSDQIPFCTSPSQLQEVTLDPSLSSSVSFAALRSPDKTSPMRGRSVKEFEELLSQLKKENFNLKLRIYFLEERLGSMSGTDKEQLTREVVELKVDLEALRKEKDEKEDLLLQASRLVELTDKQHHEQLVEKDQEIRNLRAQIQKLETAKEELDMIQFEDSIVTVAEERRLQLERLLEQVRQLEDGLAREKARCGQLDGALQETQQRAEQLEAQCEERGGQVGERDCRLEALLRQLEDNDKELQAARDQVESLKSQAKRGVKSCLSPSKNRRSPEGAEQKSSPLRAQEALAVAQKDNDELLKKVKKLEDGSKKTCVAIQGFMKRIKELSQDLEKSRIEGWEKDQRLEILAKQAETWRHKFTTTWPQKEGEGFPTPLCLAEDEKLWAEIENNNQPVSQLMKDQVMARLEMEKQIKSLSESLKQKEYLLSEHEMKLTTAMGVIQEKDNKIIELQREIAGLKEMVVSLEDEKKSFDKKVKEENESEKGADEKSACVQLALRQELEAKAAEITRLNIELKKKNLNLQELVNKELWSKNREIEKLQRRLYENRDVEIMSLQQEVITRDFQLKALLDKMADLGVHMSLPSSLTFRDALGLTGDLDDKDLDPVSMRERIKSAFEERAYLSHRVGELEEKLRNTPERDDSHLIALLREELARAKEDAARAEGWRSEAVDACALLTKRLEELARFLNSLLSRGCFLGAIGRKRRQLLKQAVENSMELSRTINMSICASNASDSMSSCLTSLSYTNVSLADMWDDGWLEDGFDDSNSESLTKSLCSVSRSEEVSDDDQNAQLISHLRSEVETLKQELIQRNKEMTQAEKDSVGTEVQESATVGAPGKEPESCISFASMTFYNSQHRNESGSEKDDVSKSPRRTSPRSPKKAAAMPQLESYIQARKHELLARSGKLKRSSSASAVSPSYLQQRAEPQDGCVSDSEGWSEPDRKVSLARMGLSEENSKPAMCLSPLRLSFDNSHQVDSTDSSDDTSHSREPRSPGKQGGRVESELRKLRSRMRGLEQVNDSLRSELNVFCRWATENTRGGRPSSAGKLDKSTSVECLADGGPTLRASSHLLEQVCHQREKLESLLLHNDAIRHQMEGIMTAMEKCGRHEDAAAKPPLEVATSKSRQLEEELEEMRCAMLSQQERLQEKDNEVLEHQCALLEAQNQAQQACIELEQRVLELETQLGEARLVAELSRQEEELARSRATQLEDRLQQSARDMEDANRRMEQLEKSFMERESVAKAEAERKLQEVKKLVDELTVGMEKKQREFERRERELQSSAEKNTLELLKVCTEEWEARLAECATAKERQVSELEMRLAEATGRVSEAVLRQTRADNEKVHLEQAARRLAAREAELLKDKKGLEDQVADLRHQLDTQVSTLVLQKSELEKKIQHLELQQNLSKLRHSEIKPYSSSQSEHNSEHASGVFLDKASSRSSGLDTGDFSSLEYGQSTTQVSLPPRLFRQRSEMSDYVSEDQAANEYGAIFAQVCSCKGNMWVAVSSQQLEASSKEQSVSRVVNSSPDLGIESDAGRFSSMDIAPAYETAGDQRGTLQRDYAALEQENAELKRRLIRTRRTLEETVSQLTAANHRKKQMEKAICKQLTKTQHVLKATRCHLEAASGDDQN